MLLIEILSLVFVCRKNGQLAVQKGLKPIAWWLYTVLAWIIGEFAGCLIALAIFVRPAVFDINQLTQSDMLVITSVALFTAFGGYLVVRYILENKPDTLDNNIDQIGVDDLQPPKKN